MAEIKVKKTKFADIDLNFMPHPVTGDVTKKINENAVITSIKNLIRTKPFDRPFHPEISCQAADLLFENFTAETSATIKRTIQYVIANFEPRASLVAIDLQQSQEETDLTVTILFTIIGSTEIIKTQFALERTL